MKIENFKLFLERYKRTSSEIILDNMWKGAIPVSPKFFEETFGTTEMYCFQAIEPHRIESVMRRQHKKNTVSAFTHWDDPDRIFWGAVDLGWHDDYDGGLTIIAILKGKVAFKGGTDLWTATNSYSGRRWIVPDSIRGEIGSILVKIQNDILDNFNKAVKKLDLKYFKPKYKFKEVRIDWEWNSYDAYEGLWDIGDTITHMYPKFKKSDFNKEKNKVIKLYHDIAYNQIKKYKKQIEITMRIDLQDMSTKYNEILCYDYQVQEFIVYYEKGKGLFLNEMQDIAQDLYKTNKPFTVYKTVKDVEKALKEYQKKNKGKS